MISSMNASMSLMWLRMWLSLHIVCGTRSDFAPREKVRTKPRAVADAVNAASISAAASPDIRPVEELIAEVAERQERVENFLEKSHLELADIQQETTIDLLEGLGQQ